MPQIGDIQTSKQRGLKGKSRYIWSACEKCGKERWAYYHPGEPISPCCRSCSKKGNPNRYPNGKFHPSWTGGRSVQRGYIKIRLFLDDFYIPMANHRGYVFEHRLVMAKHLGRCLQKWEVVHHKNGIRDDNRLENLELTTTFAHIKDHNKGYKDGYNKGYYDGKEQRVIALEARVTELEAEIVLLKSRADFEIENKRIVKGTVR